MSIKPKPVTDNNLKVLRFSLIEDLTTSENNDEYVIEGYALKFDSSTKIGNYFIESIARGAVNDEALDDVLFFVNHDSNKITLARSRRNNQNSTLQLKIDDIGLHFRAVLDVKNNPEAATLYSAVKRGDVDGMSFWMKVQNDEWSDLNTDMPKRKITKISKIFEISAVNWPAYESTEITARSKDGTLDNDKMALDNAKAGTLDNVSKLELRKKQILFNMKNQNQGGNKS